MRARYVGLAMAMAALALGATSASADIGAPGLGDPFFPLAGNGGYDVGDYGAGAGLRPATKELTGPAHHRAATQNLDRFDLDLRGFAIAALKVNGRSAASADGQELVITPETGCAPASRSRRVDYAGVPEVITDPDDSIEGWVPRTTARSSSASRRARRAGTRPTTTRATRRPSHRVTVPEGLTAMGNGVLVDSAPRGGTTTCLVARAPPMAPYLATARRQVRPRRRTRSAGIPAYVAVDPRSAQTAARARQAAGDRRVLRLGLGPTRSERSGRSSTTPPTSATRWRRRRKPNFDSARRGDARARARAPVVRRRRDAPAGRTSGCTRASPTWSEWLWSERTRRADRPDVRGLYVAPATTRASGTPAAGPPR